MSFGWSYPPGVTGNELEIAGPSWEGEVERTCTEDDAELTFKALDTPQLEKLKGLAVSKRPDAGVIQYELKKIIAHLLTVAVVDCPFEGTVDAWAHDGRLHWTCPVCGHEYEEDQRDE